MSGCVLHDGKLYNGYARVWRDGRNVLLHRYVYEQVHGPIAPGHEVHHECGIRHCSNIYHLHAIERAEHVALHYAPKTHCPSGHALTPDNTYEWNRTRKCRVCIRAANARQRAKRRRGREARETDGAA